MNGERWPLKLLIHEKRFNAANRRDTTMVRLLNNKIVRHLELVTTIRGIEKMITIFVTLWSVFVCFVRAHKPHVCVFRNTPAMPNA